MSSVRKPSPGYSATDLNKAGGKVLDSALAGPVRISRRDQRFVLLREDELESMLEAARSDRPRTLEDMLRDYDRDKIAALTSDFMSGTPSGREIL